MLEAGLIQYQCQMYIYYTYAPDQKYIIILSYVDDFFHWYTYEDLGKWSV